MYNIIKEGDTINYKVTELILDSPEDVAALPTNVAPGSTAICISTAQVYMLNNSGEWKPL